MSRIWIEKTAEQFTLDIGKLKSYREAEGLSQDQIAAQIHVSARTLARWEAGSFKASRQNWAAVSEFLAGLKPAAEQEFELTFRCKHAKTGKIYTTQGDVIAASTREELVERIRDRLEVLGSTGIGHQEGDTYKFFPASMFEVITCDASAAFASLATGNG